jgi:Ribbon-helix-helix protein, copG family
MEHINIRVDGRLKRRLESMARAKGISLSALVRRILEERYLEPGPRESCYDLALRLGLLGSAKGPPTDLSTNPDHMEGFGEPLPERE